MVREDPRETVGAGAPLRIFVVSFDGNGIAAVPVAHFWGPEPKRRQCATCLQVSMFYGWKIVGVTMVTNFISVGFVFYSYGVVFKPIAEELGGNRFMLSIGLAMMNVATGTFAPFLGQLLDRWSIRYVMSIGSIALTLGLAVASQMTALWQFYVILATLLGLGAASIGGLPGSTLIANWFERRRGMALGISTMGVSASGMVVAPVGTYLIGELGWRRTLLIYAAITITVVLPAVWFFVVNRPEDLGQFPDGDSGPEGDQELPEPTLPLAAGDQMIDHAPHFEWSAIATLRDLRFWLIALSIGLNFFAMSATLTHMIPHVTDLGYSATVAAYVLAASAGVGVIGKLVFGWLTDYMDTRVACWGAIAFQAAGIATFLFAESYPYLLLASSLFGFGMGGIVPLWSSLVGDAYERRQFGRVMGLATPCMLPLQTTGLPYAGFIFDRFGSYQIAFWTFLGAYALSAIILGLLSVDPKPTESSPKVFDVAALPE